MPGDLSILKKPELRGLLQSSIQRNLVVAIALSAIGAVGVKMLISDPRKAKYAEYYKHYSAEEAFERMQKAGHMSSATP